MKVFNSAKCPDPDFARLESDQILTTSTGGTGLGERNVLIDFNGNVLTRAEDV